MMFPLILRMVYLRFSLAPLFLSLCLASTTHAQSLSLPDAPLPGDEDQASIEQTGHDHENTSAA